MNEKIQYVYAGDVTPQEAWEKLSGDPRCVLVDVRTDAEWSYVGLPDISSLDKELVKLSWKVFPQMTVNSEFVASLANLVAAQDTPLLFLCRSGVRSKEAAHAMTEVGYRNCFNIVEGFEGDPDDAKHRNTKGGWKVRELPWTQG